MSEAALISEKPRYKGVLHALRKKWPDKLWIAKQVSFGHWDYYTADGKWHGCWVACSAPQYDGDDDTFITRFYIYRKGHSPIQFIP